MNIGSIAKDFVDAARELDLNTIEREVQRRLLVRVSSKDRELSRDLLTLIGGSETRATAGGTLQVDQIEDSLPTWEGTQPDLGIVLLRGAEPSASEIAYIARLRAHSIPTILIVASSLPEGSIRSEIGHWFPDIPRDRIIASSVASGTDLLPQLVKAVGNIDKHWLTGIAHDFVSLRSLAVDELIRDASFANGQFALFSSIPAFIPLLGGFASSIADLLVLTKNQVTLVFRIAAIYGRDVKNRVRVATEIAPVIGSAFLWRTAARSLVALLPAPLGMLPKTLVAYTGTFTVGQMAHYYYREGKRPTRESLTHIRSEALRLAQRVRLPGSTRPILDLPPETSAHQ
jgi:uncharacterized protein (DUF697 family)